MDVQKIQIAIERLKMADEMSRKYMNSQLYVCISGGKDSSVITELAIKSGLDVVFRHSLTTVDAPETIYFIRSEMNRLRKFGYKTQIKIPQMSMWKLIEHKKGFPPLRTMRYCCHYFKERPVFTEDGKKAFIVTGVRWAESVQRKKRDVFEAIASNPENAVRISANDNDLGRKLFENCRLRGERICNPIIDWTDDDVWDFIKSNKLPYNPLYDQGFKRIGCIGCPMASKKERDMQFERWPKYKKAYIDAMDRGIKKGKAEGKEYTWTDGGECFDFWMKPLKHNKDIDSGE